MAAAISRIPFAKSCSTSLSIRSLSTVPQVANEPVLEYMPGTPQRELLVKKLKQVRSECVEIPVVIGGKKYFTGNTVPQVMPSDHSVKIANVHLASKELIELAIKTSVEARNEWAKTPFETKASVFLQAADLISTKYRYDVLATTMQGQSKNAFQAEIDAVCETIDFIRLNTKWAGQVHTMQPDFNSPYTWNRSIYRPLEGFVAAITPFNFTAIGANLGLTPALMGNGVVWKPSVTAMLSNYTVFKIFEECGLPPGVVNFVPADPPTFGDSIVASPHLACINFTGSTRTFNHLWKQVGCNVDNYNTYPRLIGECGGKNFHLIHPSADIDDAVFNTLRSAFEYQGQKCSACSRLYVPESIWPRVQQQLLDGAAKITLGQPEDFTSFMTAVIDEASYSKITRYISNAPSHAKVLFGGKFSKEKGYFVHPTIVQTTDPKDVLLREEIFGPVLTCYVFPDKEWNSTLKLIGDTTKYALTGAVFCQDRKVLQETSEALRDNAGNFYVNCKSTGAVVGQQPFGGARQSGTNDKAGSLPYLLRFASPQSVKENFVPISGFTYSYMKA